MRINPGRFRGVATSRTRPAADSATDLGHAHSLDRSSHGPRRAATPAELVQVTTIRLGPVPRECAAVVGLTEDRVDAICVVPLERGESPATAAMQAVLQTSDSVAMVVFTEHDAPQWVIQPCYLLRDVVVVTGDQWRSPGYTDRGPVSRA